MYDADEYNSAEKVIMAFRTRAVEVMKIIFSIPETIEWLEECEQVTVETQTLLGETRVIIILWMGDSTPFYHWFRFPVELMNLPDDDIPRAYTKWRKEQDELKAATRAARA